MKVLQGAIIFVLAFFSTHILAGIPGIPSKECQCDKDNDCDQGFYCNSCKCEQCVPCETIFRRQTPQHSSSGGVSCVKSSSDCGACLPGYQADELVNQQHSDKCFPLSSNNTSTTVITSSVETSSIYAAVLGLIIFLPTIAFITIFPNARKRVWSAIRPSPVTDDKGQMDVENQQMMPSAPQLENEEEMDGLLHIQPALTLLEEQRLNQAVPIGDYHMPIHTPSEPDSGAEHFSLITDGTVVLGLNESTAEDQHPSLTNDSRNASEIPLDDLQQSINSSASPTADRDLSGESRLTGNFDDFESGTEAFRIDNALSDQTVRVTQNMSDTSAFDQMSAHEPQNFGSHSKITDDSLEINVALQVKWKVGRNK